MALGVMSVGVGNLDVVSSLEAQHGRSVVLSLELARFVESEACIQVLVENVAILRHVCHHRSDSRVNPRFCELDS